MTNAINAGDTAWILTSTALVLFMTIPALALQDLVAYFTCDCDRGIP